MKTPTLLLSALALSACGAITTNGSYEPVPAGYAGPVATLADSGVEESPTTAQIFAVVAVDGQAVSNSFFTTAEAKGKPGYDFSRSLVQRRVPVRAMKLMLKASHNVTDAKQAMMNLVKGRPSTLVEGEVDFTPRANGRYVVRGELLQSGSTVWVEDATTRQPVTAKVKGSSGE